TRDLLRRRMYLVHKRAELITHLEILNAQNNLPPFGKKLGYAANRVELNLPQRFTDPSVQMSATLDLDLIDKLDELIAKVELHFTRTAKVDDGRITGCAPFPASGRSWRWCCFMKCTRSTVSSAWGSSCRTRDWSIAPTSRRARSWAV